MKRALAGMFAVVALAGSGIVAGAGSASAAPAGCKLVWHDKNTAGVSCKSIGTFHALAKCKNGSTAIGAAAYPGTTSYAYCSSYGSSLKIPVQWNAARG